jgi:glycine dehydrogenase
MPGNCTRVELDNGDEFARRHIGPSRADMAAMLETVGAKSLDALIAEAMPEAIRSRSSLAIGEAVSETAALRQLRALAQKNKVFTSLIGQGYYGTITPKVLLRNILENPAWYTAYTPYQPEISQGRLEAMLNFQTMVADLTGLDLANASLLDEATACAEAMAMAERVSKSRAKAFFVDDRLHPQNIAVLRTRAGSIGWELVVGNCDRDLDPSRVFGAIFQYPDTTGAIRDFAAAIAAVNAAGGVSVICTDLLALTLLKSPGELGADIAVGSSQRFGVPMGYGGPHAAFIACRDKHKRSLPGRLVGVSVDSRGVPAYRLALQTREQHIRREKATSNICTAQVLLAVMASMYAVYHGPEGLTAIARKVHRHTDVLAAGLHAAGVTIENGAYFDTLLVKVGPQRDQIVQRARDERLNFRLVDDEHLGISLDETTGQEVVEAIWRAFGVSANFVELHGNAGDAIPVNLRRTSEFLTHPVFHRHRSETEILRYIRKLADRDLALDRTMIPLGSCTMKLNATAEMIPITWPEFADLHPYAPPDQAQGYAELFANLEKWLCIITGYDAFSMQPNSGAQGEYAGLLAIRAYHKARGHGQRRVCLIPSSAHGTNPASAQMAGMEVVVVACDERGNVNIADLEAKARAHSDRLAAAMVTYPSTHGVFEEGIRRLCDIVHAHGGQVYLDGANLNAQVGLARPGDYGADVGHVNLHKTFCIPHGGGGPGMGPIGVKAHLVPYLPGHTSLGAGSPVGPVSAAPNGSASILPISYAYILMMGSEGLRLATQTAILSANYIAVRLRPYFPLLYANRNKRVAHECIIDMRSFKDELNISVEDIAKRLIDYGFHAPTMSFPVPGTLMIEPTESESRAELDRFVDAMIGIRAEIDAVADGRLKPEESPLRYAPHTVRDIADDDWNRKYSRSEGCFPSGTQVIDKYWCPVNRVDNAYGDRNVFCSCPPIKTHAESQADTVLRKEQRIA